MMREKRRRESQPQPARLFSVDRTYTYTLMSAIPGVDEPDSSGGSGSVMDRQMNDSISTIVAVTVMSILLAALYPVALDMIFNVDTSSWSGSTESLWTLIPLMAVIGALLTVLGFALGGYRE